MVEKISKSNDEVLGKFIISITNKYQPNTVDNYRSLLTTFSKTVGKSFGRVTREDIDVYLASLKPSTAEILKSKLRNFFKWFYHCDKKTLPEVVSHLESNKKALAPTKTDADVLVPEEIEKIINAHANVNYKAIIETFIVTGARCNKLFDEKDMILNVYHDGEDWYCKPCNSVIVDRAQDFQKKLEEYEDKVK